MKHLKQFLYRNKWVIKSFIIILISLLLFLILYFTGNWNTIIGKTKEKINGQTFLAIAIFLISVLLEIIEGWISDYISGFIFPGAEKATLDNTKKIIIKQEQQSLKLSELSKKLDSFGNYKDIDLRKIRKILEKLSKFSNLSEKGKFITKLFDNGNIDEKEEKLLNIIISNQEKLVEFFNLKIQQLSKNGYNEYASALKKLAELIKRSDADSIINNYDNFKRQKIKEQINLLKSSIEATKQLFAFNETINLYEKLIIQEPSAKNHFNFAYYLQKLNYFDKALEKYEEALKIYRELTKENPRTYLPDVATTLNNLAVLQKAKNEFPQALEKYEEALKVYRELAKENPRTYLPNVAGTLYNLTVLYLDKNGFPQALEKYEEALKIYSEFAKENLSRYEIDYAKILIIGVYYFNKGKSGLGKARIILGKFKEVPNAQRLLKMIEQIDKE